MEWQHAIVSRLAESIAVLAPLAAEATLAMTNAGTALPMGGACGWAR